MREVLGGRGSGACAKAGGPEVAEPERDGGSLVDESRGVQEML